MRGLTALVGFKTYVLAFDREARVDGEGKYNRFTGSFKIGFNGIVAFSDYLLNLMVKAGLILALLTLPLTLALIVIKVNGWYDFSQGIATLFVFILLMTGIQLLGLGILGSYISRIYEETKNRPKFIVETFLGSALYIGELEREAADLTKAQNC